MPSACKRLMSPRAAPFQRQPGPGAADGRIERRGPRLVERVIDARDPGDVWTEARPPREVERDVDAEAAAARHRIDEVRERRWSFEDEIVAFRVVRLRDRPR